MEPAHTSVTNSTILNTVIFNFLIFILSDMNPTNTGILSESMESAHLSVANNAGRGKKKSYSIG